MTDSPLLVTRSKVTSNGTVYLDSAIRKRAKIEKGEEVEVRYIEGQNVGNIIVIQKVLLVDRKAAVIQKGEKR